MSRYDKYSGVTGGFRARLAADFAYTATNPDYTHVDLDKVFAMGLNSTGQVGKYDSVTTFTQFCGVMVLTKPKAAGDVVDIMTAGEIVELLDAEIKTADVLGAGKALFADTTAATAGKLTTTGTAMKGVGVVVEMNTTTGKARLVVRCQLFGTGA